VSVDGGAGDAELLGDLLDGVLAFAVVAGFLIHLPGELYLTRAQFRLCPPVRPRARAAASPSIVRSDIRACSNSAIAPMIEKNSLPTAVEGTGTDALRALERGGVAGL
jgi:hypothetical protein